MGPTGQLMGVLRPRLDPLQAYRVPALVLGGAGLVSTAEDYGRFAQMLLNGGELYGVRILKSSTVDMMWRNQLTGDLLPIDLNGWMSDNHTGWGLGFTVSTAEPVLSVDWQNKTGSAKTGAIGWGGGMHTNWIVSALIANCDHSSNGACEDYLPLPLCRCVSYRPLLI